ncbi:RNA exonuclease 4 [Bufo gargarizans]|uniref:RNA exonuclease 4 n=1 Tax=Bufo gargarizans TaxID=30331 RepID=UPI001CF53A73|nr:RNA exonuclease 4 [Bufo gargarizans]XP_044161382.1 RNA exonuclease 4 [Bufo gargarizans]
MAKAVVVKDKASTAVKEKNNLNQTKKKKKKEFWKKHPKIAAKEEKPTEVTQTPVLPPKTPQEFSSNWKALQTLLKPESSSPVRAATTPHKKQDKGLKKEEKEKGKPKTKKEIKVNGKEKSEPRPKTVAPKVNGHVKETLTADKKAIKEPETTDKNKEAKKKKRKLPEGDKPIMGPKKKPSEDSTAEPPKIDLWFDDVDPDDIEAALGTEAGQIARQMQGLPEKKSDAVDKVLVKDRAFEGLTRTIAIDCEMVGVGTDGEESILARVSIVNQFGKCVYDKFVKPTEQVTDYRTAVSGIRPQDIKNGEDFKVVQKEVSEILKGRILVGHAVHNDLKIFFLDHPKKATRDTQKYKPFKQRVKCGRPSLKLLCENILNVKVQTGEHCSIQDAQAAMRLYTMEKKNWEAAIKAKYNPVKKEPLKKESSSSKASS